VHALVFGDWAVHHATNTLTGDCRSDSWGVSHAPTGHSLSIAHVAAMYDALVGSLDWGSGFLDTEEIESILIVAELAGFDVPERVPASGEMTGIEAITVWRKQVAAKARAMAADAELEPW
jgi:hypothetical protein